MAQDLLRLRPEAVIQVGDYYWVDYDTLDVKFEKIGKEMVGSCSSNADTGIH
jgi:hypothetical protein